MEIAHREPETVPAEAEVSEAVVKKVSWKITAEESAIDYGVAPPKEEEATAGEDLQKAEGVDGDAAVVENGNEAEGADAEVSSSDEEDNDEEESNADEDDSSQDGEDSPAEVKTCIRESTLPLLGSSVFSMQSVRYNLVSRMGWRAQLVGYLSQNVKWFGFFWSSASLAVRFTERLQNLFVYWPGSLQ